MIDPKPKARLVGCITDTHGQYAAYELEPTADGRWVLLGYCDERDGVITSAGQLPVSSVVEVVEVDESPWE